MTVGIELNSSRFELFSFSAARFYRALANTHFSEQEVRLHRQAQYLYGYLRELGAETIVIEHGYIDADYLDDYANYYVRCFTAYDRHCKRLHFFARNRKDLSRAKFLALIQGGLAASAEKSIRKSYLGFVVVRPLPEAIIGRTLLKTYDSQGGRRNYPCTRNYEANLFGLKLETRSLPFQEQDTVLAACATVAVWCCLHKTGHLFGTPVPTPAEITRLANQVVTYARPIPSHGLNVAQICNAIRQTGLEAEVITVKPETPVLSLIYGHLTMGLPVILGIHVEGQGGHAITVCGYSIRPRRVRQHEVAPNEDCIPLVGLRIDKLFAHDDQVGPFSRIEAMPSSTIGATVFPITFRGSWTDSVSGKKLSMYPTVIVVPVYRKIRVTFWDVYKRLYRLNAVMGVMVPPQAEVEWDIHLQSLNEYKSQLRGSPLGLSEDSRKTLMAEHPRFIWRAILRVNSQPQLELLADATDMPRAFPFYHLSWLDETFKEVLQKMLNLPGIRAKLEEVLTSRFFDFLKQRADKK